jgi:hypothetical protein
MVQPGTRIPQEERQEPAKNRRRKYYCNIETDTMLEYEKEVIFSKVCFG